jgi:predicted Zn-dependent peptidase
MMTLDVVPGLEPNRELTLPPMAERTFDNGLTVITIERRSVPLVELRLRVPFESPVLDPVLVATSSLLGQTLFSGTAGMSTVEIAAALQTVGGGLSAGVDADRLLVSGNALASGLPRLLGILADVVIGAIYPDDEVTTERGRLVDRLQLAQTQPAHLAHVALQKRMYGTHPYALQTPTVDDVSRLGRSELFDLHAARMRPAGATLVLVGDIDAHAALDVAEEALAGWSGADTGDRLPAAPALEPGPLVLVDRPGAVQSSLRVAFTGVSRTHPDHAAMQLANLVFGGYFSSRWVENLRERRGYTYGPHSGIDHSVAGTSLVLSAEVATEVTAPALVETFYELGRIATVGPEDAEIEQARQYALGSLLLGMSTQAGLAGLASTYAGVGLRLDYLAGHAVRLAAATGADVAAAAATYLAPARGVSIVLGDASVVQASVSSVLPVVTSAGA